MKKCFDCGTNTKEDTCPNCGSEDVRNYYDYYDEIEGEENE